MELKIVNTASPFLHASLGISEERADELGNKMTEIFNNMNITGPIINSIFYQKIAEHCNTNEELVFCVANHCSFLVGKGYIL